MATLHLSPGPRADSVIVEPSGDLDIVSRGEFDDLMTQARLGHHHVVLDMSGVTFLDTSAMAVIVSHWKALRSAGGALLVAGADYTFTKTLWITGLAQRLPLYSSVAEALAALPPASASPPATGEDDPSPRAGAGDAPARTTP